MLPLFKDDVVGTAGDALLQSSSAKERAAGTERVNLVTVDMKCCPCRFDPNEVMKAVFEMNDGKFTGLMCGNVF